MKINGKTVLLCTCEGTIPLDAKAIGQANDAEPPFLHSELCRAQMKAVPDASADGQPVLIACTQEVTLFEELMDEYENAPGTTYVNVRETAGWSEDGQNATPKIVALLAAAALDTPVTTTVSMESKGRVLVYGNDETALDVAGKLAGRLEVTTLLNLCAGASVLPPMSSEYPLFCGEIAKASGHFGAFEVQVDNYAPVRPSAKQQLEFAPNKKVATSAYDLIVDLSDAEPLFPAHTKRDGYFKVDAKAPTAIATVLFEIADMVGEFSKPRYVTADEALCAHSRNGQTGCTRCLDVCETSAIAPAGDRVQLDPFVCAGCGDCTGVCPTGALSYTLPNADSLLNRLRVMLLSYAKAGGAYPILLVHDGDRGSETVNMIGRHGRGLPKNVLPFAVNRTTQLGLDFFAAALSYGASAVRVHIPPASYDDVAGLTEQIAIANQIAGDLGYGADHFTAIAEDNPDSVEAAIWATAPEAAKVAMTQKLVGGKQGRTWRTLRHLNGTAPAPVDILPLGAGAPFGAMAINVEGCTLCLACVGACPAGALGDNPERPTLTFIEQNCVQCGLCKSICPENVVSLTPQLNFTDQSAIPQILKEEDPFECISCGKPFATKSVIASITERMANHPQFAGTNRIERLKMCEDCRVIAEAEDDNSPLAMGARPVPRTTEDYINERDELTAQKQPTKH